MPFGIHGVIDSDAFELSNSSNVICIVLVECRKLFANGLPRLESLPRVPLHQFFYILLHPY